MKEEKEKLKEKSTNASGEWNGFGGGKRAIETFSKTIFIFFFGKSKLFLRKSLRRRKEENENLKNIFFFSVLVKEVSL